MSVDDVIRNAEWELRSIGVDPKKPASKGDLNVAMNVIFERLAALTRQVAQRLDKLEAELEAPRTRDAISRMLEDE